MIRRDGFTFVELLISIAVLAVVLFSGVTVSKSAMSVAQDAVRSGAADGQAISAQTHVRQLLLWAGRSTLEATPVGGAREPMQEGVTYDNVSFRRAVGGGRDGAIYDPAPGQPPITFAFAPRDASGIGDLTVDTGNGPHPICGGLGAVEFVREGSRVTVRLVTVTRGTVPETQSVVRRLVLRNP
jgi:prepilin-type N-terminal cleavage/methylation domain-containing protein